MHIRMTICQNHSIVTVMAIQAQTSKKRALYIYTTFNHQHQHERFQVTIQILDFGTNLDGEIARS
jgi:hypothetical protein